MQPSSPALLAALAALALAADAGAQPYRHGRAEPGPAAPAPAEAAKVVDAFHAALARGDAGAAAGLLADAVLIFEAGGAETKSHYAAGHLAGDAAFAQAVPSQVVRRTGGASGEIAWVASEGRTRGRYRDRDVDRVTTETMVLVLHAGAWRIVHAHWSSRAAPPARP